MRSAYQLAAAAIFLLNTQLPVQAAIYVDVDILPSATTTGALVLERVELEFTNGRATTTVPLNADLRARANIRYRGNGPLTGRWLVDGRPLQSFNRTLTFGTQVTLETADLPPLPTFEPGAHQLTIQFTAPAVSVTMPVLRYVVESTPGASALRLVQPLENAALPLPRRDTLLGDARSTMFTWSTPIRARGLLSRIRYGFAIFDASAPNNPLVSAQSEDPQYNLPAVLAAQLPLHRELRWQVQALDDRGRLLATSEARRLSFLSASVITLTQPADSVQAEIPLPLRWTTSSSFANYDVRAYRNETALRADLDVVLRALAASGTAPAPTVSSNAIFQARSNQKQTDITTFTGVTPAAGSQLQWIVLGLNSNNQVNAISELGRFNLPPNVGSLNGLPTALQLGGFEVVVDAYESGAGLNQLSGNGTVRFARDTSGRAIPVQFQNLRVEAFSEQTRRVSGEGVNATVIVSETLKGRVTAGQISQTYTPALALSLGGYAVELRKLTLTGAAVGAGSAHADLTLIVNGYANASGVAPYRPQLPDVVLEAGGDFYVEVTGAAAALHNVNSAVAGLTLQGGSLVVDFSRTRDFIGRDAQPVRRDSGIFLMGGGAELEASALFAVTQSQKLQLAFEVLELKPAGFDGRLDVTGSDVITPVMPAGYKLRFNRGMLSLVNGAVQASSLFLDGYAELPDAVKAGSGMPVLAEFRDMRVVNGQLLANAGVAEMEWGSSNSSPFRLFNGSGELRLPFGASTDWQGTGLRLTSGTLDSPLRPVATDTQTAPALIIRGGNASQRRLIDDEASTTSDVFDLRIRAGGVNGSLRAKAQFEGKIGDFAAGFNFISLAFTDNAITSSKLDGHVVIPKPADLKLAFTDASISSSGDIMGPRLVSPTELLLDFWRVKLLLPATVSASNQPVIMLALAPVGVAGREIMSDVPELSGPVNAATLPAVLPLKNPGELTLDTSRLQQPSALSLSRSTLRLSGASLRFLLEANYGPLEFDDLSLQTLDIGANGEIKFASLQRLSTRFLQMNAVANSQNALRFASYSGGAAASGAPLVTLDARLTFPRLGERSVSLAHTASGARVDNIIPNSGGYGNEDFLRYEAADLVFQNAYAEGTDQYKEFLGKGQIKALKTLYIGGLTMVGADDQGVYERIGLGIGVDPVKAASLYAGGVIPVASKLGAGAVNLATGGKSTAETEVAQLVGSVGTLVTEESPKARTEKLVKALADSITLARRIHRESGGSDEDNTGTALAITGVVLNGAVTFTKDTDRNDKRLLVAIADALDMSLAVIVKSRPNGQALSNDARNAIELARLAVKAARAGIDDGKFTQSEWLGIADQLLVASKGFSTDRNYQFMIALLAGTVEVARASEQLDDATTLRIASRAFRTLRESGLIAGNDANNVLLIAQALIDGMQTARDMPIPNNAVSLGRHVLDVAAGPNTNYGAQSDATVKGYLKLANRTLELAGIAGGGIQYAKAGRAVQATLHESAGATDAPYVAVDHLVTNWVMIDSRPLATTITELQSLIVCEGQAECAASDMTTLVSSAVAAATSALNATDFRSALGRLAAIRNSAKSDNRLDDYEAAFNDARKTALNTKTQQIEAGLIQQLSATTIRHVASDLIGQYLGIESVLVNGLELPGNDVTAFYTAMEAKLVQFVQQLAAEVNRATTPADAEYPVQVLLGIERQRQLLGLTALPDSTAGIDAAAGLFTRFRTQAEQEIQAARTSDQMQAAILKLLSLERQSQLLGRADDGGNWVSSITTGLARAETLLQAELTRALQVGRYGLEPIYTAARQRLFTASKIEDADDAVALIKLFKLTGVPVGYTAEQRNAQGAELTRLLEQKAAVLYADALSRMRSGPSRDLYQLASRYFAIEDIVRMGRAMFNHEITAWIAQSKTIECTSWRNLHERLRDPAMRFAAEQAAIRQSLVDMYARCLDTPAVAAGSINPNSQYTEARGAALEDLSKYLEELSSRQNSGQPEAFLKEELAWKLADRIKTLTAFFISNQRTATQRTLGRVHHQTDYMLRFRQSSTPDRVIAAVKLLSEPLLEQADVDANIKREVQYLATGLSEFATLGGTQKKGVDLGIDLAAGLASARFAEGSVEKSAISLIRQALYEARKPLPTLTPGVGQSTNSNLPAVMGVLALAGVGAAAIDQAVGGFTLPPAVMPTLDLFAMLAELSKASDTTQPGAKLELAMAFLDKASKLPAVDHYVKPLINPVAHLAAPDTNQNDYLANVLLAELVAARHDDRTNAGKAFKSTCPSFTLEQGVQMSAQLSSNSIFVCAIDLAREAVGNHLKGAIDPASPAGQAQNARVVIGGMRTEAVFARTSGDETLSGISGLLEYRNGNLSRFDFLATFGLAGQFETASQVSWNGPSQILRIEQATLDGRDSGLLASLGLSRAGSNRLFNSDYFNNPIKYLLAEIGSPASCLNMTADFGLTSPIGNWNTGRQNLATCFNPFAFDLSLNSRGSLYVVIGTEGRMQLFFGNGSGGFKMGATIGLYPTAFGYGAFVDGAVDVGMGAGATGLEVCGQVAARAGATAPGKPADCPGNFVPDNLSAPNGPGVCRHAASIGVDLRLGTNYQNFFVKGQGGLDLPIVYLGGWFYISPTMDGGVLSRFPADRYGGFTGATQLSCGSL